MSALPPRDIRTTTEDWAAGDLAECIDGDWTNLPPFAQAIAPKQGQVYRVAGIEDGLSTFVSPPVRAVFLEFERPGNSAWHCTHFRKLRPSHEPASAEFQAYLRDTVDGGVTVCM